MKKIYVYKETQLFHILIVFIIVFLASFQALLYFGEETYASLNSVIGITVVFVVLILLFFNFTIAITEDHLKLSFGLGIINIKYSLKNMLRESIAQEKIPGWFGMGIRLAPGGRLVFNTKPGMAVCFNLVTSRFRVCIVTNNPDELECVLKEQC
ncbi:hypothetical protein NBRC110019_19020 [Neptunitalea chrysea]|uniref:PH domain-containing protein n=1 Tax=Neptunitalea chrysea TaxID=1647581 RepID=A0A9W6B6S6_9FLAO|nr:hypothetical protein [Neptunitalea chrysea]GLB52862.1 hypothetical protein NBRC110019_19020 [Neptunitalea chrysea]